VYKHAKQPKPPTPIIPWWATFFPTHPTNRPPIVNAQFAVHTTSRPPIQNILFAVLGMEVPTVEEDEMPIGCVYPFAGPIANIPANYLLCDGRSLDRATYAALFAALGNSWGAVDGSHFNIPDYRNKTLVGAQQDDSGVAKTNIEGSLQQSGGSTTLSHGGANTTIDSHTGTDVTIDQHSATNTGYATTGLTIGAHSTVSNKQGSSSGTVVTSATHSVTEPNSGSGHRHSTPALSHTPHVTQPSNHNLTITQPNNHTNVVPPYGAVTWIIRYQ
jgi:microcystin-dependent protein